MGYVHRYTRSRWKKQQEKTRRWRSELNYYLSEKVEDIKLEFTIKTNKHARSIRI
jgi:hypothetical protein